MTTPETSSVAAGICRHTLLERVVHGQPFDKAVVEEMHVCNAQRVLVIAAPQARGSVALQTLSAALGQRYVGEFCEALPHVPVRCIRQGALLARELNVDHLVALGGGSVIDAAKAIALLLHKSVDADAAMLLEPQDLSQVDSSDPDQEAADWLRITVVPQTLSAAEFTWFAGVSDPDTRVKNIVAHAAMAPRTVILDPVLTMDVPLPIFLASGVKAMDHAIERLVALRSHPVSDATSLHALQMLAWALPAVHRRPGDLEARVQCQLASWLSITGGNAGVKTGASHALGHTLGIHAGVAHGLTSCVLLPSVLRWNVTVNQRQQRRVIAALDGPGEDLGSWVERFVATLGLPARLRELNVPEVDLPSIAQKSMHDPGMRNSPRPVQSAGDALEMLRMAW
ncbi:Maleylacetate reductase [Bordetella tumulicola]